MKAILMLEDGRSFPGDSLGDFGEIVAELIFNTAVVGYQEMLTDPANAGKILILTYPLIGNYGCAPKFNESKRVWAEGLVIKEKSRIFSNWQAKYSFDEFVKLNHLPVICGIDTRSLTVHLRNKGGQLGVVSTKIFDPKELLAKIDEFRKKIKVSSLPAISVKKITLINKIKAKHKIAVLDLGITNSVIAQLKSLNIKLMLFPYNTKPEKILSSKPDGLIICNGPEEDVGLEEVVSNVKGLIKRLPILGISTGCQVLAQALGVKINKLKLGHRGVNYPLQSPASYRGEITVQNHSCVLDVDSLNKIKDIKITAYNLNDRTVEEIESNKLKVIGTQYYTASPGFGEANAVFKRFLKMLKP